MHCRDQAVEDGNIAETKFGDGVSGISLEIPENYNSPCLCVSVVI
jgi:hypothetical protein